MKTTTIRGVKIAYDDEGAGPTLLFVHGHPFNRSMWRPQLDFFGRSGWRVIAPDLRGYGDSEVVPGTTMLGTFVQDLKLLLDHLDVDEVILIGLSMGGQIVMEFFRSFPRRAAGLVLADTSALAETASGRKARYEAADRLLREGMSPYSHEVLPKMVAPNNIDARPELAQHVLSMMLTTPPQGAAAALRGRAKRPDYLDSLRHVSVPTLVVVGAQDEFTPLEEARRIHEQVPHSSLRVIDGAAHMPNLEREKEFNEVLESFLTKHRGVSQPVS